MSLELDKIRELKEEELDQINSEKSMELIREFMLNWDEWGIGRAIEHLSFEDIDEIEQVDAMLSHYLKKTKQCYNGLYHYAFTKYEHLIKD